MILIKLFAISLMMMSSCAAWSIMVLAPFPTPSHWSYMESIINELLNGGHTITAVSAFSLSFQHDKYFEYVLEDMPAELYFTSKDYYTGNFESEFKQIYANYNFGLKISEFALNDTRIRKLINRKGVRYDLVLADNMPQDSLFMFSLKYKCPIVTVGIDGHVSYFDDQMGLSPSFVDVPHSISKYDNEMNFKQRSYNYLLYAYEDFIRKWYYLPAQNKLAKKYFKDVFDGRPPELSQIEISATIVNQLPEYNVKPKLSTLIDIPGIHIKQANPLPLDLKELYDESQEIIYFSMGSYSPSEMPKEKLIEIMKAFDIVKKTVFMTYDSGSYPIETPPNVVMRNWFPQNDLLGRSKVNLFITNGGTLSFQEAIKNRIPMIIIPFTGEQYRNGLRAERDRIGVMMNFDDITAKSLADKIKEVSETQEFYVNIKGASIAFQTNAVEPLKKAIFEIENVIRNGGAPRLAASKLGCFERKGYDVITLYFLIFATNFGIFLLVIITCVRRYRAKEEKGKFKYY